jgi:hypothetical protein
LRPTQGPSSASEKDLEFLDWIHDQLTILAEAFGEPLTQERAEIYVGGLLDITRERLQVAFRRSLLELKWFPKLAEIRELTGSSADQERKVEAQAAWEYANEYLRKWGVARLPIRSEGKWIVAPPLEPRLEYAVRQIGGLWRLNQVTDETYHFMFRDFCEAYTLAPVAELMENRLLQQFNVMELAGRIGEQSAAISSLDEPKAGEGPGASSQQEDEARKRSRHLPEELTQERKEELRQKLAKELAKRGASRAVGGLT